MHVKAVCLVGHPRSRLMIDHGGGLSATIRVGMLLALTAKMVAVVQIYAAVGGCARNMEICISRTSLLRL